MNAVKPIMSRHILVEERPNPSTDYFIRPAYRGDIAAHSLRRVGDDAALSNARELVLVRYLTPSWQLWIERYRAQLERLAFFMDDDLFDLHAHAGLPLRYRWKLYRLAWRHQQWLRRMGAELWVSTPWLADKYASWNPKVMTPGSPYAESQMQNTVFYHGSSSHAGELQWLRPVMESVLQQDESLSFEVIGGAEVRALFAHLPRVHVLHPMSWNSYQALVSRPGRIIGLAPLIDNRFNKARSPTKFFDITQAGAVGLYADHPAYRPLIDHDVNGMLLPMDRQVWIDAILALSSDGARRSAMLAVARLRASAFP